MSNFELFYLIIGPVSVLTFGAIIFFGGRWLDAHHGKKLEQRRR